MGSPAGRMGKPRRLKYARELRAYLANRKVKALTPNREEVRMELQWEREENRGVPPQG